MKIFRDLDNIPEDYKNAVVTLGNFDGLHLGHMSIIAQAKTIASEKNAHLAIMTFEPHPRDFFMQGKKTEGHRIYSLYNKLSVIKSLGIDCVYMLRFNTQLTNLSAHEFIKNILVDKLNARHIITGDNFCFGKNRRGDKSLLKQEAKILGFEYTDCHPVTYGTETISSSSIRKLLNQGDISKISILINRPYSISGHVKHGEKRGTKIGFPTANISLSKLFIPRYGVYAVQVKIANDENIYNAVANIGVKPTFGTYQPLLEVHLFDTEQDLYGKRLCVEFIEFIRPEQKFTALEELISQIKNDCIIAKDILLKKNII